MLCIYHCLKCLTTVIFFIELYEFCLREGYADGNLIAKWKKVHHNCVPQSLPLSLSFSTLSIHPFIRPLSLSIFLLPSLSLSSFLLPSLSPSFPPSLPPSLPPSFPLSLPPSFLLSLLPSLPPSLSLSPSFPLSLSSLPS